MSLGWFVFFYLLAGLLLPQAMLMGKPDASFEIKPWGIKSDGNRIVITNWRKHLVFRALAMIFWGSATILVVLI